LNRKRENLNIIEFLCNEVLELEPLAFHCIEEQFSSGNLPWSHSVLSNTFMWMFHST